MPVIMSKVANALIAQAEPNPAFLKFIDGALGATGASDVISFADLMEPTFASLKSFYGGLWVGGRATLIDSALIFKPNAANRIANAGELDINVDLRGISGVAVQAAVLTQP